MTLKAKKYVKVKPLAKINDLYVFKTKRNLANIRTAFQL